MQAQSQIRNLKHLCFVNSGLVTRIGRTEEVKPMIASKSQL